MADSRDIDLRAAINAVSDVVQNRPRPLREFDQIHMKAGDMVLQSEMVAKWSDGKRLAFIGDGDAISVCVAYLQKQQIFQYGPSRIVVFDFDERVCSAVERFADKESIGNLSSCLYNTLEPFCGPTDFENFYTNPPWGASNGGDSVVVFMQRGMEAIGYEGQGMVVIADDPDLEWPQRVLANVQKFGLGEGFYVQRMQPQLHSYHLDDAPNLKSCNLILQSLPGNRHRTNESAAISDERRTNFYGKDNPPRVRYVREKKRVDYGTAPSDEYRLELLDSQSGGDVDVAKH